MRRFKLILKSLTTSINNDVEEMSEYSRKCLKLNYFWLANYKISPEKCSQDVSNQSEPLNPFKQHSVNFYFNAQF